MVIFKPLIVVNVYSGGPVAQPGRAPPLHGLRSHRGSKRGGGPGFKSRPVHKTFLIV